MATCRHRPVADSSRGRRRRARVGLLPRAPAQSLACGTGDSLGVRLGRAARAAAQHVPSGVAAQLDLAYGAANPDMRLDVFYAATLTGGEPRPTLVWVHRGGWISGNRRRSVTTCASSPLTVIRASRSTIPWRRRIPTRHRCGRRTRRWRFWSRRSRGCTSTRASGARRRFGRSADRRAARQHHHREQLRLRAWICGARSNRSSCADSYSLAAPTTRAPRRRTACAGCSCVRCCGRTVARVTSCATRTLPPPRLACI